MYKEDYMQLIFCGLCMRSKTQSCGQITIPEKSREQK